MMHKAQKIARFRILVSTMALIAFFILIPILGIKAALAGFSLLAIQSLEVFLFRKKKNEIGFDERDREINRRAGVAAGVISYLSFIIACFIIGVIYWSQQQIPIGSLVAIVLTGGMTLNLSHSIYILVAYGREDNHDEA